MTTPFSSARQRPERRPLSEEVAAHVRSLIMSGQLEAGEFVRLDRIAEELDVSATPVREGLQALRGEGFLTFEPRRGFMVAPLSPDDVHDLFLVQAEIAGELAARAAAATNPEWIATLRAHQAKLSDAMATGRPEDVVAHNRQVHRLINLHANAPKLAWMLSVAVRYVPEPFFLTIEGWSQASLHDHDDVLNALEAGDSEKAREAMRLHIVHAGDLLAEHLRAQAATGQ
ncbi:GntR family transcriptional regulator [Blastococcus saxobsidens]|uniref:GntR family transcriptional regulator n=1 Tax=Blastococcus saxobsidens TaxID=138336 RepID=A0A4Q7YCC0_9ACTN|nr:GntR family transcriptional regulator [Blastococcus saxobsidens]RZU34153.1 GntR family transcriptional regulator [Blastococcus saxobsidens]